MNIEILLAGLIFILCAGINSLIYFIQFKDKEYIFQMLTLIEFIAGLTLIYLSK